MKKIVSMLKTFILLAILLPGCSKSDLEVCNFDIQAAVNNVSGPDITPINQPATLFVYFGAYNHCGLFGNFSETSSSGNTKTISVIVAYKGCVCRNGARDLSAEYNFTPVQTGTYNFRFLQTGNTYITHTVVVQ